MFCKNVVCRTGKAFQLFVTEPGDDIWLWNFAFFFSTTRSMNVPPEAGIVDIHIKAAKKTLLAKTSDPCHEYGDERMDFIDCVRDNMKSQIKRVAKCWMPELSFFLTRDELGLESCIKGPRINNLGV